MFSFFSIIKGFGFFSFSKTCLKICIVVSQLVFLFSNFTLNAKATTIITNFNQNNTTTQSGFTDVDTTHTFFKNIQNLFNDKIVSGYPDGTFRPSNQVTRAEMSKFVVNAFKFEINTGCGDFKDFSNSNSESDLVKYTTTLKCRGIVLGYPDGTFRPNNRLTRGEAMAFVIRSANLVSDNVYYNLFYNQYFIDVPTNYTFYTHIMSAFSHNIISGYGQRRFMPNKDITRGEMAKIIDISRSLKPNLNLFFTKSNKAISAFQAGDHFLHILDLQQGARLEIRHGSVESTNPGQGVYGGNNPKIRSNTIETFENSIKKEGNGFAVYNASFYRPTENPTQIAFLIKRNGSILTDGYAGASEFKNQKKVLQIWNNEGRIDITDFDENLPNNQIYDQIKAPDALVSLSPDADKNKNAAVGRTFVGIRDSDGDGKFETALIFISQKSSQWLAERVLRDAGAKKVIMFDGGGSSQFQFLEINTNRAIPVVLSSFYK
jgi:hypothetical protein